MEDLQLASSQLQLYLFHQVQAVPYFPPTRVKTLRCQPLPLLAASLPFDLPRQQRRPRQLRRRLLSEIMPWICF